MGNKRVGLAIQGGGFPAGAFAAGVIRGLVEEGAFEDYDICAFSGTSAGALVAAVCWGEVLKNRANSKHLIDGNLTAALEKQWTYLAWPNHGAWIPVCPPAYADWLRGLDAQWMNIPLWRTFVEQFRTPFFRWMMGRWIEETIPIEDLREIFEAKFAKDPKGIRPGLVLGSADVVRGLIKTFREDDLSLSALLASGSLDDCNGVTTIVTPPHDGTYLDGAWGDNPPINELLDYDLQEIWVIQHFPKAISEPPHAPAERKERKDELWQNSLVEHEVEFVEFVNYWYKDINEGILKRIDELRESRPELQHNRKAYLRKVHAEQGKLPPELARLFDEANDFEPKKYSEVKIRKIEMRIPRELGSTIVNVPWFINNLMDHGKARAHDFVARDFGQKPEEPSGMLPGWWAWIPKPLNDLMCGSSVASGKFYGPIELFSDLWLPKITSGVLELLPAVIPQLGFSKAAPSANKQIGTVSTVH